MLQVPSNEPSKLFAFLNPLATSVWSFMFLAYMAVSFSMFFLARFSPYEWRPHTENNYQESRFTISNCFWFVAGVSLKQDAGITPKVLSRRITMEGSKYHICKNHFIYTFLSEFFKCIFIVINDYYTTIYNLIT